MPLQMVSIIFEIFLADTISETLKETNLFLNVAYSVLANRLITFGSR